MNTENKNYWQDLKSGYMECVKNNISDPRKQNAYGRSMDVLIEYAAVNDHTEYSPEIGYAFFEAEKCKGYKGHSTADRRKAAIRRLNDYLYGSVLWQRPPRKLKKYRSSWQPPQCPEQFAEVLEQFLLRIGKEGLKEITVADYRRSCTKMLINFTNQGVKDWNDINPRTLIASFLKSTNKGHFVAHARRFFRYLADTGIVEADYSSVLIRPAKRKPIPSVYSEDEIQQLLNCIETITPQGKRDYAVVLIAVRLGLRASDISNLQFENVDFDKKRVEFIQVKTSVPHRLLLTKEVSDALHDYINNGREPCAAPYIFVDGFGHQFTRQAISHMVARNFKKTNVDFGHRHHGSHALRMTFASQLVGENVPYEAVRALLGQVDPNSTRHYVEFSIESLRTCALEIPLPSGRLEHYLTCGGDA